MIHIFLSSHFCRWHIFMNLIHDYQYRCQLKRGHELFIIMSVYDLIRFSLLDYSFRTEFFFCCFNGNNDDADKYVLLITSNNFFSFAYFRVRKFMCILSRKCKAMS